MVYAIYMTDDQYTDFDKDKLVGTTPDGTPYFRPSSPYNTSIGLGNAMNKLRQPHVAAGANLTTADAKVIEEIVQKQFAKKVTTTFSRQDRLELNHQLELAFRAGKLSRLDIQDAQAIIDKLSS